MVVTRLPHCGRASANRTSARAVSHSAARNRRPGLCTVSDSSRMSAGSPKLASAD